MVWATNFGPSGLAPWGGSCCSLWASCCCVWRIWHDTPIWAVMNASTIVLGGGGGRSLPLIDAPKPSGELHVGPTIGKNWAFIKYTFMSLFSSRTCMMKMQLQQKFDLKQLQYSRTKNFMRSAQDYEDSWLKISTQCKGLELFDIQLGIKS
jgi:hypothetical protein